MQHNSFLLCGTRRIEIKLMENPFQTGDPALIHDASDREGETDLLYPAEVVTPHAVSRLRNDAGGLMFVALSHEVATAFSLPYLHEALRHPATEFEDAGYDARPSFSLSVDHCGTKTGITDRDRAQTIQTLAEAASNPQATDFTAEFRTPGHVHLLKGAHGLTSERQGHTELGLELAQAAGVPPAVVGCEMLDGNTGGALSTEDARAYADNHGLTFINGQEVVTAMQR
jgi:3,4-dihydroxy 2-butanone 4-phosphate synthase